MDKVTSGLHPITKDMFLKVYERHMAAMGEDERAKYEGKVKSVKVDHRKQALRVMYDNGDWWFYTPDGRWY